MNTLQSDLNRLNLVASSWNLSLSRRKCVVMQFSRRFSGWNAIGEDLQYRIENTALNFVECHRDSGVLIDRELKFHNHVEVVRRAAGLSNSLLRSTVNRSPEFMVALFITHYRPILDYYSCVWNVGYVGDVILLESVQRR